MIKKNVDPKEVGTRIRSIRKSLGLSMEEFASRIDNKAKSGTISNWETGKNLPNNVRLKKIADIGETSINELLYNSNEEKSLQKAEPLSVEDKIYDLVKEFYDPKNPAHVDALKATISCFDDSEFMPDRLEALSIFSNNLAHFEDNSTFKIYNKESYIKHIKKRIDERKKKMENTNEGSVSRIDKICLQLDYDLLSSLKNN